MDKTRQRELGQWLKDKQSYVKQSMRLNILLGGLSAMFLVGQAWCLAEILQGLIVDKVPRGELKQYFIVLFAMFIIRALILYFREKISFHSGQIIRQKMREEVLNKLAKIGPIAMRDRPAGSWASVMLEQVENLHNYYSRYLPQQTLSLLIPIILLIAIFPLNWAAGLILLFTAPLIPIFMIFAGLKAADANQKNMQVLSRLSGQFLDRLRGLETLRLFGQANAEKDEIEKGAEHFRESTMEVLRVAFLSSTVLEFFTSISIAVMAVYFGFSYLGQMDFGHYGVGLSLMVGFFSLILAPEFYQPLRDLGTFYHDKAAAVAAADALEQFLDEEYCLAKSGEQVLDSEQNLEIEGDNFQVLSPQGKPLTQPLNFKISSGQRIAIVGQSGAGKTSLVNALLGFLAYQGSLRINGIELSELNLQQWHQHIAWVGQNPLLLEGSLKENLQLGCEDASENEIYQALEIACATEFVQELGLDYEIKERSQGLSGGQAQRIAIARALLRKGTLLILDEPTASLDARSENHVLQALYRTTQHSQQLTIMVTHRIEDLQQCQQILVMRSGEIVQSGHFDELQHQGYFGELLAQRQQQVD